MDELEESINISNCENEPIHIPGAVQSHGILIAISLESGLISYLSENIKTLTGTEAKSFLNKEYTLLKEPLHLISLEEPFFLNSLVEKYRKGETIETYPTKLIQIKSNNYNVIPHVSGTTLIIEIEPLGKEQLQLEQVLGRIISKMVAINNVDELLKISTKEIKQLINYDRVMIYKFGQEGHGQVIAEEKNDDLEPFLGLWYPASDIPKQARELYKLNLTRLIADAESLTAPILTYVAKEQPLDLTFSQLRAVSPMHIEYLKNMGVKSSFSISLISKGELWGLIACHNYTAKFINYQARENARLVGQMISSSLEFRTDDQEKQVNVLINDNLITLQSQLEKEDMIEALSKNKVSILSITNANGAAILFDNQITCLGETPDENEIKNIAAWLIKNSEDEIFYTSQFPAVYPASEKYSALASGVLCCILSKELKEMIIWFKAEQIQQVTWAGNPNKTHEEASNKNLSPRKSFEKWTETVKYTSLKWTSTEVKAITKIREHLIFAIKRKADAIKLLNEKLNLAYEELDAFSFTISHDLKIPLSAIKGYAQLLESASELPIENQKILLAKIVKICSKMTVMMNEILRYSQAGKAVHKKELINMTALLQEIKTEIYSDNKYKSVKIEMGDIHDIKADQVMVSQVFSNLLSNAIKYSSKEEQPKVLVSSAVKNGEVIYSIADNGIGIDSKYHNGVFELFKRMDNVNDIEGTGVGLTIAKRMVEKQHGKIWFESELGKGTTFYVLFPINNN